MPTHIVSKISTLPDLWKGILLALLSNALFVSIGVLVRILSDTINVFQILFFRQLVFLIVLIPAIIKNIEKIKNPINIKLHALRIAGAFFALSLGFITVSNLKLAEATAIGFTSVLFVAIISSLFLSESVGKSRQLTLLTGFIGVLLVVQPTFENMSGIYMMTGFGAAIAAAVAVICVRKVTRSESTINLLAYQAIFVGVLALIPSIYYWQWPGLFELLLLLLVGGISSFAQWIGVTAYKYGEANVVANVEYAKMVYSLILGYWLFSEAPNLLALIGALIIIISSFLPRIMNNLFKRFQSISHAKS